MSPEPGPRVVSAEAVRPGLRAADKQDALPQGMLEFLGIADIVSPAGYLQATVFSLIGPLLVLKLKFQPEGFDRRMVTELWLYPDGSHVLELSTKCVPKEAFDVAAQARGLLASKGVDLGGEQQTKTRMALEFYAKNLANGKSRPPRKRPAAAS